VGVLCCCKTCLEKTGGFKPELRMAEDWELWCRLASVGECVYVKGEPILVYRLRAGSAAITAGTVVEETFRSFAAVFDD
jgi:hypothetical protein